MWSKNESNRVEHRNWGQVITNLSSSYDFYVNNIYTNGLCKGIPTAKKQHHKVQYLDFKWSC